MPTYEYGCEKCHVKIEKIHRMSESPEVKCPSCGETMQKLFSVNFAGFIFKGGTPSIHWKEKRLRMKRSEKLSAKQQKYEGPRIKPNIAGVETESWSDAQKLAKEAGLDHESYTPWVEREKKRKLIV